jgi:Holliday junction resolvase-like predicted endonuclease
LRSSFDSEALSTSMDWKQFEALAEFALRSFGYRTIKNYRLKKPAQEIDLLAVVGELAFGIDCKHWKRTVGHATMSSLAESQIKRCQRVLETEPIKSIIPVILTWHDEKLQVLENGVAVVPIHKISDFLLNWESSESIRILQKVPRTIEK